MDHLKQIFLHACIHNDLELCKWVQQQKKWRGVRNVDVGESMGVLVAARRGSLDVLQVCVLRLLSNRLSNAPFTLYLVHIAKFNALSLISGSVSHYRTPRQLSDNRRRGFDCRNCCSQQRSARGHKVAHHIEIFKCRGAKLQ
jgi:hypothetical protein